jgi:hypothetical protein
VAAAVVKADPVVVADFPAVVVAAVVEWLTVGQPLQLLA